MDNPEIMNVQEIPEDTFIGLLFETEDVTKFCRKLNVIQELENESDCSGNSIKNLELQPKMVTDTNDYEKMYKETAEELNNIKKELEQYCIKLQQTNDLNMELEKTLSSAYQEVEEQSFIAEEWKANICQLKQEMIDLKKLMMTKYSKTKSSIMNTTEINSDIEEETKEEVTEEEVTEEEVTEEEVTEEEVVKINEIENTNEVKEKLETEHVQMLIEQQYQNLVLEDEISILKNQKISYEETLKGKDAEIEKLTAQHGILEEKISELENQLEIIKEENKCSENNELEEPRCNIRKEFEQQLCNEQKERSLLLAEKEELEIKLQTAAETLKKFQAKMHCARRDFKKFRALLRNTEEQLKKENETPENKYIEELKNRLEDVECARVIAVKAKHSLEAELFDVNSKLEQSYNKRDEAEEQINVLLKENHELTKKLNADENILKMLRENVVRILQTNREQGDDNLVPEKLTQTSGIRKLSYFTKKFGSVDSMRENLMLKKPILNTNNLLSNLKREQESKANLETEVRRLNGVIEQANYAVSKAKLMEEKRLRHVFALQLQLKEAKLELNRCQIISIKKVELEKRCKLLESEIATLKNDLKLARTRMEHLQAALKEDLDNSVLQNSDSDEDNF